MVGSSLDGGDVRRGEHLIQRLHHVTHPHQPRGGRVGGRVLADLRRSPTDVQTPAGVARQSRHLPEESGRTLRGPVPAAGRDQKRVGEGLERYLPGHQLQGVLLEGLHLVQARRDDLLQLLEGVRLEGHPGQTLGEKKRFSDAATKKAKTLFNT